MYPGYLALGIYDENVIEIVNNPRAYAYAESHGICWLENCDACPDVGVSIPGGPRFVSPVLDPAPWYSGDDPDSWGFLGVVGLEVTGAEGSTRKANVSMGIGGIGVIGPTYMEPRTMVLRALVIATDECSLQFGLNWLREHYQTAESPCEDDPLTFFDCCPCVCEDDTLTGPCWAMTYRELLDGPPCVVADPTIWWPATYAELLAGPPVDDPHWCAWPDTYRGIEHGSFVPTCCVDECVLPYLRQFHQTRITEGPTVLSRPVMSSGALCEIEMTIVAADPKHYGMTYVGGGARWMRGDTLILDEAPATPRPDPWLRQPVLTGAL